MSPRRALVTLVVVAAAVPVGACGIQPDGEARVAPAEEVPFDLLASTTTTRPPGADAGGDTTICLALDGALLVVGRARTEEQPLSSLSSLVSAGPTEGEAELGLRSAVDDDVMLSVSASGGLATVDLAGEFGELPGDQQLLALAQLTCTLTAQPDVQRVAYLLDGASVEVPVQGGSLVDRPVTRSDYRRFIAN